MVRVGRNVRWLNDYRMEVEFSKDAEFEFHQVWYDCNGISIKNLSEPIAEKLRDFEFPCIIHALLDISEFEQHVYSIRDISKIIGAEDVIIHPVCKKEKINDSTMVKLSENVKQANIVLKQVGLTLYIENNSKIDPINYKADEIKFLFDENPEVEFLLDIAHIDSYKHLEDMVSIKMPKKLHLSDKRQHVPHEHLPLGKGNIDFKYVFSNVLKKFDGDIIFEIIENDNLILQSKRMVDRLLTNMT